MAGSSARDVRAGGAYLEVKADVTPARLAAKEIEQDYKKMIGNLKKDFDDMRNLFGALADGAKTIAKPIMEYEDAMKMLQATLSLTNKEMERFNRIANSMKSSYTPTEIVRTMTELGRAGLTAPQIEGTIKPTLQMSKMSGYAPEMVASMLTNTATIFKVAPEEMGNLADKLMMTANSSNMNLEDLSYALKFAAQTAQMAGMSLEQMLADLAAMANRGVRGSTAGTSYARIVRSMARPETAKLLGAGDTSEATKAINELGAMLRQMNVKTTDAQGNLRSPLDVIRDISTAQAGQGNANIVAAFQKLFGDRGMLGASALADAQRDSRLLYDKIANAQGYVGQGVAGMETSASSLLGKMRSQFETELNRLANSQDNAVSQSMNTFKEAVVLLTKHMDDLTDVVSKLAPVIISYMVASKAGKLMGNINGTMVAGAMMDGVKIAGKMITMQIGGLIANELAETLGVESDIAKTGLNLGGQAAGLLLAPALLKAGTTLAGTAAGTALLPAAGVASAWLGYEYYKVYQEDKRGEELAKRNAELNAETKKMLEKYNDALVNEFFSDVNEAYSTNRQSLALTLSRRKPDDVGKLDLYGRYVESTTKIGEKMVANLNALIADKHLPKEMASDMAKQLAALNQQEFAEMQAKLNSQKQIVDAQEQARKTAQEFLDQLQGQEAGFSQDMLNLLRADELMATLQPTDTELINKLSTAKKELMASVGDSLIKDVTDGISRLKDAVNGEKSLDEKIKEANKSLDDITSMFDDINKLSTDISNALASGDKATAGDLMTKYRELMKTFDGNISAVMEVLNEQLESVVSHFGFGSFNAEEVIQRSLGLGGRNVEQAQLTELKKIRHRVEQMDGLAFGV